MATKHDARLLRHVNNNSRDRGEMQRYQKVCMGGRGGMWHVTIL